MIFARIRKQRDLPQLNLLPVMNLMVTLIPFLLLSAAFYHVGIIPTSSTAATEDVEDDARSVTVNLIVSKDRIEVSATSGVLEEETLELLSATLMAEDGRLDYQKLTDALYAIKMRFDLSDTVIVMPKDDVPYDEIVRVLDATRERVLNRGAASELRIPLFPVILMSRLVV
ncbi:MAG: biopolymer transporter ExbD [Myxococcota bacterium]|jgi:biopolymer transport protein ExbD|nr:biopolymer transporter ExbD [Myxococcota bacterium]